MKTLWLFAWREFLNAIRNLWLLMSVAALLLLSLSLALLDSAPAGQLSASALHVSVVGLTSLGVYLIPLIALLISFDTIVGEQEQGTLPLLLSYPVARRQLLLGKFLGALTVLIIAVVIGYGSSALVLMLTSEEGVSGWQSYAQLLGSSILLGAVFIALGCLISAKARKRSSAIVLCLSLWLLLVVLYDLGLLALVVSLEEGSLSESLFVSLLISNPADAYRVMNLSSPEVGKLVGLWGGAEISAGAAMGVMTTWTIIALWGAIHCLNKKQL